MILDFLFGWFKNALDFVLNLLPSWQPLNLNGATSAISGFTSGIFSVVSWADWYVPAKFAFGVLLGVWIYQAAVYVVNFVIWGLTKLHILGGE